MKEKLVFKNTNYETGKVTYTEMPPLPDDHWAKNLSEKILNTPLDPDIKEWMENLSYYKEDK